MNHGYPIYGLFMGAIACVVYLYYAAENWGAFWHNIVSAYVFGGLVGFAAGLLLGWATGH
jgi:ABC-type uncharacterized transport system permease subunit